MKPCVIIPTNNGAAYLPQILDSLPNTLTVAVIDTGTTDLKSRKLLLQVDTRWPNAKVIYTPFHGYATGALLWMYWNYDQNAVDEYLLLQDSLICLVPDVLEKFKNAMPGKIGAVAWTGFAFGFDDDLERAYAEDTIPDSAPPRGIFGPILYTNKDTLDWLNDMRLLPPYPVNQHQSKGSERIWAMAFHKAKVPVVELTKQWDAGRMENVQAGDIFKKLFVVRP